MHRVSSLTAYPLGDTLKYKSCSALSAANGETPKLNQVISGWIENNGTGKPLTMLPTAGGPTLGTTLALCSYKTDDVFHDRICVYNLIKLL